MSEKVYIVVVHSLDTGASLNIFRATSEKEAIAKQRDAWISGGWEPPTNGIITAMLISGYTEPL